MSDQSSTPAKALGVTFTAEDFHTLAYHARRHQMSIREFIEYMACSYVAAMRQQEQASKGKNRGDQ